MIGHRRLAFLLARATLRSLRVGPAPALFIMGHMRCGSTLLLHILLTNPEFIGCGERISAYRSPLDLDKLEIAARIAQRAPFRRVRYAVDQINHSEFTPNLGLLRDGRVRCIFLVRDPRPTIQSILDLMQTFYQPWSVRRAVDYYSERLQALAGYRQGLGNSNKTMAMTYNELVDATFTVLRQLESFLVLDSQLREEYVLQPFTGKRGDPSESIKAGRIVRQRKGASVEIPDCEMDRAIRAYQDCAETLGLVEPRC